MVRFGVIGTSGITERFLSATMGIREFSLTAVYSRSLEKAKAFGMAYGAEHCFDDLEEFAKSDTFDAVYIASPNCFHHDQAILLMKNKKHVLCEKPLASNVREVEEMFETAHDNQVVLLEAMRSIFAPEFHKLRNYIQKVGTIRRVSFCFNQQSSRYNSFKKGIVENTFRPEFSNGALMDLGCYCIYPMIFLFGVPQKVTGVCARLSNGVDGAGTVLMQYEGMVGEARYSKVNYSVVESEIQGEDASMTITGIASTKDVTIRYNNGFKEVVHFEQQDNNMEHEIRAFIDMVNGRRHPEAYETTSKRTAEVMEEARKQMGIHYPADDQPEQKEEQVIEAPKAEPKEEAAPAPEVAPKEEPAPAPEAEPKEEAVPKAESEPKAEDEPKAETEPKEEAVPKQESAPKTAQKKSTAKKPRNKKNSTKKTPAKS
jgi:predicted dehydrogenase